MDFTFRTYENSSKSNSSKAETAGSLAYTSPAETAGSLAWVSGNGEAFDTFNSNNPFASSMFSSDFGFSGESLACGSFVGGGDFGFSTGGDAGFSGGGDCGSFSGGGDCGGGGGFSSVM